MDYNLERMGYNLEWKYLCCFSDSHRYSSREVYLHNLASIRSGRGERKIHHAASSNVTIFCLYVEKIEEKRYGQC
jgi:hypothetical protein